MQKSLLEDPKKQLKRLEQRKIDNIKDLKATREWTRSDDNRREKRSSSATGGDKTSLTGRTREISVQKFPKKMAARSSHPISEIHSRLLTSSKANIGILSHNYQSLYPSLSLFPFFLIEMKTAKANGTARRIRVRGYSYPKRDVT